jgi:hypothetical protein
MEVEYIIERLSEYLGGIDVDRVKEVLNNKHTGVERLLGISINGDEDLEALECLRIKAFIDAYEEQERRLIALYRELKTGGVAPSDMTSLKKKISQIRKLLRVYKEIQKRCQTRRASLDK